MKRPLFTVIAAATVGAVLLSTMLAQDDLETQFVQPPASARPMTYWFWVNGNVTKEGICADLEDMQRTGLGGGFIFDGSLYLPPGPLRYGTDEWHDHVQYAISTAAELGLRLGIMLCPGWATAGGPWNSLDQSMKLLVWSEQDAEEGDWSGVLPTPPHLEGYYRDVAVLAVPADQQIAAETTIDGAAVTLRIPEAAEVRSVILPPRPGATYEGTVEFSADGETFEEALSFRESTRDWLMAVPLAVPVQTVRAVRVSFKSNPGREVLDQIRIAASPKLSFPVAQAGLVPLPEVQTVGGSGDERGIAVIDLTDRLQQDGSLQWKAPPGRWTILRFGFTTSAATNHPAAEDATGWEIDKFDAAAVEHHLERSVGPIIKRAGRHAGKALAYLWGDSWEAGPQNWTAKMPELFRERRGYDMRSFLPCLTGRLVETREKSEAFLRDFRLTLGDLYAEEYFGTVAKFAHKHGMKFGAQGYGAPFDQFKVNARLDIPSVEFWMEGIYKAHGVATSVAHTTGKNVVMAESFTSRQPDSRWTEIPSRLKVAGDSAYAAGVNLFVLHSYIHQPRSDLAPGFTHGRYGTHFGRLNSWWPLAKGWTDYLSRCQFLLQVGAPVSDVLFVVPDQLKLEERNLSVPWTGSGLRGDYLAVSQILSSNVQDGLVKTGGTTAYRAMVLPGACRVSLAQLRHLAELRKEGATIYGPFNPLPAGLLDVDNFEWQRVAADFGNLPAPPSGWGITPDFQSEEDLLFLHRTAPGYDIYFVSNPHPREVRTELRFRATAPSVEFWDPLNGRVASLSGTPVEGGTLVRHTFAPSGSGFFVFAANPAKLSAPPASVGAEQTLRVGGEWKVVFQAGRGAPEQAMTWRELISWPEHPDSGVRFFSGVATYATTLQMPEKPARAVLDLGAVFDMAEVIVNGKSAAILWTPPFEVEIGSLLEEGSNSLEIRVANRWINRLVGDEQLPPDAKYSGKEVSMLSRGALMEFPSWWQTQNPQRERITFATWKHYDGSEELTPSGLLGPVFLRWGN